MKSAVSLGRGTVAEDGKTIQWRSTPQKVISTQSDELDLFPTKQYLPSRTLSDVSRRSTSSLPTDDESSSDHESVDNNNYAKKKQKKLVVPMMKHPDVYGQIHPIESPELIAVALQHFDNKVRLVDANEKDALLQAERKCPQLLTKKFKLMFLRTEVFDVDLAVKRYVLYWNVRLDVFGPVKAFQPLTLQGALSDDIDVIRLGFFQVCLNADASGRPYLLLDPSKLDKKKYTVEGMTRACWYFMHVLNESEMGQKRGILMLFYLNDLGMRHVDRKFAARVLPSIEGVIPNRCSAAHVFRPPPLVRLVIPFMYMFLKEEMKRRVLFHVGSQSKVLKAMEGKYGLPIAKLPTELGGKVRLCIDNWIDKRQAEGK